MHETASDLIHAALAYLKDPLLPKQVLFASAEECAFFFKKQETIPSVSPPVFKEKAVVAPYEKRAKTASIEEVHAPLPAAVVAKEEAPLPATETLSPIKKMLRSIAPHLKLLDQVPDDAMAQRIANAWKEKLPDTEVVLLACDTQPETLELLKGLAKAINQNLAKSKVMMVDRLEKEKRWDLFLEKNPLRLIIASDGMQKYPDLMRHYRAAPATSQFFLDRTPLLTLSAARMYQSLEHKTLLWKTLCQMLKK